MRVRSALLATSLATTLVLVGCGDGDDAKPATSETTEAAAPADDLPDLEAVDWSDQTGKAEVTIITRDNTFTPQFLEVSPGTTVTFDNKGRTEHNAITSIDDKFESIETGELDPGMTPTRTFDEPGDYPFYCSLHGTKVKGMYGAIRVVES